MLPGACVQLRLPLPPVAKLRAAGVAMAVATDLNPGSSWSEQLPMQMWLATTHFGMTVEEAWLGVTRHAATALGLTDAGVLAPGARGDVVVWKHDRPVDVCYRMGASPVALRDRGRLRSLRLRHFGQAVVADLAGLEDQHDDVVDARRVVARAAAARACGSGRRSSSHELLVRAEPPHVARLIAAAARGRRDVLGRRLREVDDRVEDEAVLVAAVDAEVLLPGDAQPGPSPRRPPSSIYA